MRIPVARPVRRTVLWRDRVAPGQREASVEGIDAGEAAREDDCGNVVGEQTRANIEGEVRGGSG